MKKRLFAGLSVTLASAAANAGNIQYILTPTAPGPYAPNTNVTICVSLLALDPNDAGSDGDPDNPLDQTLLAHVLSAQIDRALSTALFVGNPIVPASGDCSAGTPLPGGSTFTVGTVTVWATSTIVRPALLYSLTPGTPRNIFRFVARSSPQPGQSTTVDVIGPCSPDLDIGAQVLTLDGTTWKNCYPNAHGGIVGSPLQLVVVPEPATLALALAATLFCRARRRPFRNRPTFAFV